MERLGKEQLEEFKGLFTDESFSKDNPLFPASIEWLRNFPTDIGKEEQRELFTLIRKAFNLSEQELQMEISGVRPGEDRAIIDAVRMESELWAMIPKGGFYERYAKFTRRSEAPLAYHLFSAFVGVGAIVNRRVWLDMGLFKLHPNLGVIIIGPSGLKKTTAANVVVDIINELGLTKVYSEKLTPEALVEAMRDMAQGLVYAPEMAVFLGKAKYMEGIIPLLTRFMDCPTKWSSETIMRSKTILENIAISVMMCTTPDWFVSNTPPDTFGGGFVARNILVVQEDSPREEPLPTVLSTGERQQILAEFARLHQHQGEVTFSPGMKQEYFEWYRRHKRAMRNAEHDIIAAYYQRKPDHVLRITMCLHLAEHWNLVLCQDCFIHAVKIMDWIEQFLPPMLKKMFKTQQGADQEYVTKQIANSGGMIEHVTLLRKVQWRMHAQQLYNIIVTLKEAGQVVEVRDNVQHTYVLKERM